MAAKTAEQIPTPYLAKKASASGGDNQSIRSKNTLARRFGLFTDKEKASKITVKAYK